MFAVKGWSLPAAAPAVQTEKKKEKKLKSKKSKSASEANSIPVAKRAQPVPVTPPSPPPVQVTPDNVLALYEKVIEGKTKPERGRKRGGKNNKKKFVPESEGAAEGASPAKDDSKKRARDGDDEGAAPPKKKTLKEKKREKKAAAAAAANGEAPPAKTVPTTAHPDEASLPTAVPVPMKAEKLTPLQQKMRAKLSSARFRHINETLYTTPSEKSLELFKTQPEMYSEYHTGFRQQVTQWPENPVDVFINQLATRAKVKFQKGHTKKHLAASTATLPLPRDMETGLCTVADLGCGDAKIAATFNTKARKGDKIKVLSYDLQASTPQVTVADIANLPLKEESVDIAIFCLALMGTNFLDFIDEAYRVLRWRGELWIAEIKSRFHRKGGARGEVEEETQQELVDGETKMIREAAVYKSFVEVLEKRGFTLRGRVDSSNKMFVRMEFVKMPEREKRMQEDDDDDVVEEQKMKKQKKEKKGKTKFIDGDEVKGEQLLKPCVYKLR